jgi:hypothetical protein
VLVRAQPMVVHVLLLKSCAHASSARVTEQKLRHRCARAVPKENTDCFAIQCESDRHAAARTVIRKKKTCHERLAKANQFVAAQSGGTTLEVCTLSWCGDGLFTLAVYPQCCIPLIFTVSFVQQQPPAAAFAT